MMNMNPNQTKVTTRAFAAGEERTLSAEEAELLFGGGTVFRVQVPGPLKGSWVVTKVNKKSIKISSLVGPDGRPPADQPEDTRATMSFEKWLAECDVAVMRSGTRSSNSPAKDRSPNREGWRESPITVTRTSDPRGYSPIPQSGAEAGRAVAYWADSRAVDKLIYRR